MPASGLRLFQQLGIKPLIDFLLMRRITIRLKSRDEVAQPRRQNDQVTCSGSRAVCVRFACGNKDGRSRTRHLRPVAITKIEFSFQHMPGFVIGVVDMESRRSTSAPLMETERSTGCGKGRRLHASIVPGFNQGFPSPR